MSCCCELQELDSPDTALSNNLFLQVLCLAVYFALVIKKVDEEDFKNVEFDSKAGKKNDPL